jgi:hemoglobin
MRRMTPWKFTLSLCLTFLAATGTLRAEDKTPAAKPLDRHAFDEAVYESLRGIIDSGATMYNQGDWNGCYRLWEGTLMSLRPLLDHRPKLAPIIDTALAEARQDPMLWHRAWVLRPALNKIRADIDADYPHGKKAKEKNPVVEEPKKPDVKEKPSVSPEPVKKTMWDRLGGQAGVTHIVDDFVNLTANDPSVDFFRHNKYKLDADHVEKMKREFVEQISEATGGPLKYKGPDMKKIHKGMGITDAQFDAAAADLKKALEKNKVDAEDMKKILDAVGNYRKEIVEPKKPEDKKPEDKKPEVKNPSEKQPEVKKPEDKKPEDKKPEDKKAAAPANVTGNVMFKGQPVGGATISLVSKDGKAVSSVVAADGSYQLAVKPGEYSVTVSGPAKLALPAKYADPKTTGLKYNVVEGKQSFNVNLQ